MNEGNGEVVRHPRAGFEASAESKWVEDVLDGLDPGEVATYADLSSAAGMDVQENRHVLNSARRRLLRDKGKNFGAVIGVGLKRLDDSGSASDVSDRHRRIRKASHRALRIASTVDPQKLNKEQRFDFLARTSLLRIAEYQGKETNVRKLAGEVEAKGQELNAADLARALEGAYRKRDAEK